MGSRTASRSASGSTRSRSRKPAEEAGSTAVAVQGQQAVAAQPRPQPAHPIVAAIEERMPAIAQMLPAGMSPERFRAVVVQALSRNPELLECTPLSVITAVTEAAEAGLEPTGVLGKAWLLPYNKNVGSKDAPRWEKRAQFIPGWRGFADLLWRADRIIATVEAVRAGDEFSYQRGTEQYLRHVPVLGDESRESDDDNITYTYVVVRFPDGRTDFEVMSRAALERIRDRARRANPVWASDFGEMAKKTPLRRIAKRLPLSAAVQAILASDEEYDLETPVERVAAAAVTALPAGAPRQAQASARAAALRGDQEQPAQLGQAAEEPAASAEPAAPPSEQQPPIESATGPSVPAAVTPPVEEDGSSGPAPRPAADAAPPCAHPADKHEVRDVGVVCGLCGELIAKRDPEAIPAASPAASAGARPRGAKEENYWQARVHATGAERGLDHDAIRLIAAAVQRVPPAELEDYSMAGLDDELLEGIHKLLERLTKPTDVEAATLWVGQIAEAKGLAGWEQIDPLATVAMQTPLDAATPAQWLAFGLRLHAGEYDAPAPAEAPAKE